MPLESQVRLPDIHQALDGNRTGRGYYTQHGPFAEAPFFAGAEGSPCARAPMRRQPSTVLPAFTTLREATQGVSHASLLFTLSCFWAVGPSALPCAGGLPPQRPPYTMPRWRRVAGVLSVPPVAHPRRAAKPSAATTVGAGTRPAHSHPKSGCTPRAGRAKITSNSWYNGCNGMGCYLWAGQWVRSGNTGTGPSNLARKDVSAAETDTLMSENIIRQSRVAASLRNTPSPSKSTTKRSRI